jgi:hypothetical protein
MSWELHDLDRFTCSGPDAKSAGARPRQSHALPHGRATELKQAKPRVTSPRVSKGCGSGAMTYETLRGPGPIGARSDRGQVLRGPCLADSWKTCQVSQF